MREPTAPRKVIDARSRLTDKVLAVVMMSGIYVVVEPAPFDAAILAAGLLLLASRQLRIPRSAGLGLVLLALFAMVNLVALPTMRDPSSGYRFLAITLYLLGLWVIIVAAQGRGGSATTEAMLWGYGVSGALAGASGVAAYLGAPIIGPLMVPDGRLHGLFKDPNVYGAYLVPAAVIAFAMLVGKARASRSFWFATLLASSGGIFLSFSRGAWGNLLVSATVFFLLFAFGERLGRRWWRTALFVPPLIVLVALATHQLLGIDAISDMFSMRLGMQSYDELRFATQARAVEAALHAPLGLGPGTTETTFGVAAHSTYVRTLAEHGFLGLALIVAFTLVSLGRAVWFSIYARAFDARLRACIIAASLCGMCLEAMVIDTIHWRHYWLFLAFAWGPSPRTTMPFIHERRTGPHRTR